MAAPAVSAAAGVLAVAGAAALLTAAWIRFARWRGIVDAPGARRLHASPTPRGGGIAIGLCMLALAWPLRSTQGWAALPWVLVAAGTGGFALVGLVDDLAPLRATGKFAGQWLAASVLGTGLLVAGAGPTGPLAFATVLFAAVYVVNIWNFMDGSNGLVTVQSLLIALALATWPGQAPDLVQASLVLAGACLGFLPYNLPTARVFLGDVGSHALGAAVFALLVLSWRGGAIGLLPALFLASAILIDSGLTLARRALAGKPVWRAHREHLYQYAVRSGHSHLSVCLAYAAWTLAAIGLSRWMDGIRSSLVIWALFILGSGFGVALHAALRHRWLSPRTRRGARHE